MNLLRYAQKLFILLACLIISSGCQSDLVHDKVAAKPRAPFVTSHNPESNNKTSQVQKSESGNPSMDKELVFSNIEKSVYLTFDDGPTSATSDILDTFL
ncbi:hypothetical protein [Sporosarcina sp. FSL K6-2383]|uniref:hypothetical protein n=1 Tax=Sporosarcina sp. FSL K6-2383 TaxID=2921556 RepID=UPI00315B1262